MGVMGLIFIVSFISADRDFSLSLLFIEELTGKNLLFLIFVFHIYGSFLFFLYESSLFTDQNIS